MGIDFGVNWAADFNYAIRFYVRRPTRRSRVTRRPPSDMKSNDVIEISGPNNPKIDTHNNISVVFLIFWCDGGRRLTLERRVGRRT